MMAIVDNLLCLGICAKGYARMEYCMNQCWKGTRSVVIEQSPNYSNRTFNRIIEVGPVNSTCPHYTLSICNQEHESI